MDKLLLSPEEEAEVTKVAISAEVPRLLTLPAAADYAGVSVGSMRRLVTLRKVRFYRIRTVIRFDPADLDALGVDRGVVSGRR